MRFFFAGLIILAATTAEAHHAPSGFKYEAFCCNGDDESGDCQPIPTKDVQPSGDGYQITLQAGDHRLATREHVFLVPQSKTLKSPDGSYHLCLFPNEDTVRCFYAPPIGF